MPCYFFANIVYNECQYEFIMEKLAKTVGVLICIALVGLALLYFAGRFDFIGLTLNGISHELEYQKKWEQKDYATLVTLADEAIVNNPMDGNALLYAGIGNFYLSDASLSFGEQQRYLEQAIVNLRRALLLEHTPQIDVVNYTLGRAYFHRGLFYYELAIEYMLEAINAGFIDDQAYQYLGAAYAKTGDLRNSIFYLESALATFSTSDIKLALLELYILNMQHADAQKIINGLRQETLDNRTEQQLTLLRAQLLMEEQSFVEAEQLLEAFIAEYSTNVEAYFLLGTLYERQDKLERARYQWRRVVRLDPNHAAALVKLQ